jgi:hypothetical protein
MRKGVAMGREVAARAGVAWISRFPYRSGTVVFDDETGSSCGDLREED